MKKIISFFLAVICVISLTACSDTHDIVEDDQSLERRTILEYVLTEYSKGGIMYGTYKIDAPAVFESENFSSMRVLYNEILDDYLSFKKGKEVKERFDDENITLSFYFQGPHVLYLKGKDYYFKPYGYYPLDQNNYYIINSNMCYGTQSLNGIDGNKIVLNEGNIEYDVVYSLTFKDHRVDSFELSLTEVGESGFDREEMRCQAEYLFGNALKESFESADEWIFEGTGYHWF